MTRIAAFKRRADAGFESWGRGVCRYRWAAILACLLLAAVPVSRLPGLELRTSLQDFLHPGDPVRVLFEDFRREFGHDQSVLVAIEAPEIFDLAFLERLREVHRALAARVPHVDEITSLVNARWTRESQGELVVGGLLERWPTTPADLAALRERVYANPLYVGALVSRGGSLTTLRVKPDAYSSLVREEPALAGFDEPAGAPEHPVFLTGGETVEMLRELRAVLAEHADPAWRVHVAGAPVLREVNRTVMRADLQRFLLLSSLGILGVLYLLFRNLWAVILPFFVVSLSLACAIGTMALLGYALMPTIQFMPSFLLCVGLCDSVHILVVFFQRRRAGAPADEAVAGALGHSGLAILLTSLTTAAGLVAFASAELVPVAFLGVIAPLGVMLAFGFSVTLLPALLATLPIGEARHTPDSAEASALGRLLLRAGALGTSRPRAVVLATAALSLLALLGASRIRFGHDPMQWFPQDAPLRVATELLDRELDGVMSVEVLVDGGVDAALYDPELLRRLDATARDAADLRHGDLRVRQTVSIVDVVKEIHRALNEDRPEVHAIPAERRAVAQELLLFENAGSDDLADVADTGLRTARLSMKVPWVDAALYPRFLAVLEGVVRASLGDATRFGITGASALEGRVLGAVVTSTARSYVIAFALITPLMVLFVGDLRRGLLSMIPNLIPILFALGIMGWADVPVDSASLFVGAIILGLAVDDTIHFMHKFGQYYDATGDAARAVRETLRTTGMALLFTTLVLAAGFFAFTTAYMRNIAVFGALTGFATLVALAADVLLGPALMTLAVGPKRRARRQRLRARQSW